jgi:hypothetical protein
MTSYLLTGRKSGIKFILTYNEPKTLIKTELIDGDKWTPEQLMYFYCRVVVELFVSDEKLINKKSAGYDEFNAIFKIETVPVDTSFEAFWNAYTYKVGNIPRVKKLWENLSNHEQILAIQTIKKYNAWLAKNTAVQKLYAETYLNQKRWENEF